MGSTSSMQRHPPRKTADAANSSPGDTCNQPVNNLSKTQSDRGGTDITQKPTVNSVPSRVDTEAEMKKLREDASHLNSEFDEIDTLIQELKADAFTKTGKYSRIYNWTSLGFEDYADTDRRKLGEYLAVSDTAEVLNAVFDTLLKSMGFTCMWPIKMDFEDATQLLVAQKLSMIRMIVWNNTDGSLSFAEKVSKAGMLKYFVEDLKQMDVEDAADDDQELDNTFEAAISILQNCSRNPATRQHLRELGTVSVLLPYLKCRSDEGKLQTLFTLANIVDETESEHLLADKTVIDQLFDILKEAWADEEHRYIGFSVEEIVDGMTGLAKNDTNKKVLREKGAVPILTEIMKFGSDEEKEYAVKCIWELSFDKTNKEIFNENKELQQLLQELKSSSRTGVSKAAAGALWVLAMEENNNTTLTGGHEGRSGSYGGHVMISYQWTDQKLVLKIKESLRQKGYKIWMDVDHMEGSTLQAMAEAVQNASVVLVCMSERYKLSQNCRSEAEYAFSLEKKIVPLLMQRAYKPDGWLGMIKGTKLFFDFSGKYPYDQKMADLAKELGEHGKTQPLTDEIDGETKIVPVVKAAPLAAARGRSLADWSVKDVQNWLTKTGLTNDSLLRKMTGDDLLFLREVSHRAPEFYFNYLLTNLQLPFDDLKKFSRAVDKL
ncbi:uncharacterized protein LOC124271943 [Haliotis rubra]|uniref:uncharacterized protein LOC124271943 n=1 Tax=Haliotis rubra TaxID=36100 RepID=UPI001EE50E4F|nr:uncharacterized protein LOC124271943 [Haliotis rubra]